MWLLLQKRVWTADRLLLREWPNNYFYPLCVRNLETAQHLFSVCPITCSIWKSVGDWSRCQHFDPANWPSTDDLPSWFQNITGSLTGTQAEGARSLAILIIWTVRGERNRCIFDDQVKPVSRIIDEIKEAAKLWVSAGAKHLAALVDQPFSE